MFNWLFKRKDQPQPYNPLLTAPQPMRGDYVVLPLDLVDFDWTDCERAFLTVDLDGTVKLHDHYAWRDGLAWESHDYLTIGWIASPGANWVNCYWMRPSWYDEMIAGREVAA